MKKMKNLMITGMIVLFTAPMFNVAANTSANEEEIIIGSCEDYCTGYADGQEAASGQEWSLDKWNSVRNNCIDTSDYCKQ